MVEGRAWTMQFWPRGTQEGQRTHISVGVYKYSLDQPLDIDLPVEQDIKIEMLHASDSTKNYTKVYHQECEIYVCSGDS